MSESGAIHARIRRDIEARIMSGEWAPGTRIPYEHQLMASYGCSRMTVNRALRTLMERHGWKNLPEEWWHYTLVNEPYPDQYFDVPVRKN